MITLSQSFHLLEGSVPPLVTPFDREERIDYQAFRVIIDTLIAEGVDGLFAAGGQGEFFSLEEEERAAVLSFCRKAAAGRVAVYGNVGCITTRASVRLAQRATWDMPSGCSISSIRCAWRLTRTRSRPSSRKPCRWPVCRLAGAESQWGRCRLDREPVLPASLMN